MARWQRPARFVLGVFAAAFAIALYFIVGDRTPAAPAPTVERLDPNAVSETKEGRVVQIKGASRDIRIEFGSQVLYADGKAKLTDFKATVENRNGRSYVLTGKDAWVGTDRSSYDLRGGVKLAVSDGFTATTAAATFVESEGIVKADGPVQFNRGRMSGSGVGFTYDKQTDRLWILDKAVIKFAPEGESPGMEVTSGSAGHSRAERYLRFERGMRMTRAGQIVEATDATVFLFADRDESDRIELRGNASITGAEGTGTLQKMLGRDINLDYADDGRTLQQAIITEQASITLAGAEGATGQEFAGDWIDVTLAPDGALTHVAGNGNVKVTLPATGDAPVRTVTAPILDGKGETGAGLKELTFDNGVEYREAAGTGATQAAAGRVARARTLRATLGKSGTIDEAEFTGGFQFEEGRMETTSSDARYQIARGHLVLKSVKGATRPRVKDERLSINADSIEVSLNPRSITAAGDVSTTLASGRKRPGERGTTLLKQDEDVSVRANKLVFDDTSSAGVYTGRARLFQGQTSISAEEIKMDDKNGNLVATTNVVATLPIAGKKEEGKETHSIARADEFRYDDAKRLATLTKKARLDGGQGNVTAEQIRMLLAPADNGLTRLEAQDTVKVVLDKKEATGSQLVYDPADESYFLQGAPVRLVSGGCRETTGGSIKFFGGSERLIVDSQENRTQTRGDSKCPETPRE